MVALRGKEIDAFLARPDPGRPIILLYGPDAGLVRERADALMASAVDDPEDFPLRWCGWMCDALAANPSRLVEEAHTVPLFGGRRAIGSGRRLPQLRRRHRHAGGVAPLKDCRIVIEAARAAPGVTVAQGLASAPSPRGHRLYPDGERDLAQLIDANYELRTLPILRMPPGVADGTARRRPPRLAQRAEPSWCLYAHGKGRGFTTRRRDGGGS